MWNERNKKKGYDKNLTCPPIDKKHVREFNSGVVRAGVASVRRNMPAVCNAKRWEGTYPRLDWCWANARYYIAFNDVETDTSTYIYQEGWFLISKMVDGEYRNLQAIHHGRTLVTTKEGVTHVVDLSFKDAIPLAVDNIHTTPAKERQSIMNGNDHAVWDKSATNPNFIAMNKKAIYQSVEGLRDAGLLPGSLYKEAVAAVREAIAYTRLPERKTYQAQPWTDMEAVAKTINERQQIRNRQSSSRKRNKAAKGSRRNNRKAA
tara:strand:+ start:429 stop:1214 length:786 start_codon:yes stop_codon:yes gene_type:complete